ncbi:MAG: sigma-70 family RNA polymerase sigma factor [Rubripirellula sp.]|nr:sigma-70 family RNA polymerase sigma factor [Rubripirellula sp.]
MAASPETQPSLLVRIRNERDTESWSRFVEIYAPAVFRFLKQQGLQDADAADLTQEVMASVAAAIKSFDYDAHRGRFRGWLFTVVQNKVRNFWRDAAKSPDAKGHPRAHRQLIDQPDERHDASKVWQQEYEHRLFISASEQVRPMVQESTWLAFWNTAVDGESPAAVAIQLNMTPAAVRLAKARVIHRIKQEIKLLEGESS